MAAAGVAGTEERGEQAHQPEKQAKGQSYVLEKKPVDRCHHRHHCSGMGAQQARAAF